MDGYTGKLEITSDHRAGKTIVNLAGRLNECDDISPRTGVQIKELGTNRIKYLCMGGGRVY